ncbi:MAG: pyruvate ferredoxin oxidoreductase [Deltaproteobacteria bacterium]|nr:MAG: pyruvate ferredoxin oxidoreductase [Deltaproteobacteria bacterium]
MVKVRIINGNEAAALGAKLSGVQVVAAYPITPQSKIPETLAKYVESGELKAEFIRVESEHSALTVCISASTVGARVFTATAANGLAYMHEQLHWAAGARLPIVMALANRGLGAPWTIFNDMQDSIAQRDTGWMQVYCRDNQEIIDSIIMGYKISEQIHVPMMVCFDGFVLSHTVMPVELPDQERVDAFLPAYKPHLQVDGPEPLNINPVMLAEPRADARGVACPSYMGFRMRLQKTLEGAEDVILQVGREFGDLFGRHYGYLLWEYRTDGADTILLTMGSLANEASLAADQLREKGYKAGVVALRVFRPFPAEALRKALSQVENLIVFDKNISYGYEGATCTETKAALFDSGLRPVITNFIVGLGGKSVSPADLQSAALAALQQKGRINGPQWLGVAV